MSEWRNKGNDETYTATEIRERLQQELPGWYLDGGAICRDI